MDKRLAVGAALVGAVLLYMIRRRRNKRVLIDASQSSLKNGGKTTMSDDPNILTNEQANFLLTMLESQDPEVLNNVLITIGNMSAFTKNQVTFRECNCIQKVVSLVADGNVKAQSVRPTHPSKILDNALICLNNLSLNEDNQFIIQDVIPDVIQILQSRMTPHITKQNCMMVLTNFSVIPSYVLAFEKFIPIIVDQVFIEDQENMHMSSHRLSALKILINLSTYDKTGLKILECKIPYFLCLAPIAHPLFQREDVLLRWLTLVSHLSNLAIKECNNLKGTSEVKFTPFSGINFCFKSLFFDENCQAAMKQDLNKFLDRHTHKNDKKDLADIAEYIQAKLFTIDAIRTNRSQMNFASQHEI